MKDCCGSFTIFTTDGSIARVDLARKVLYYVPFEGLTADEIDSLNTKMRNAPEVIGLYGKYYTEIDPLDASNIVSEPLLDTYIGVLGSLPDCNILVTIDSPNESPSRDTILEFCKKLGITVYRVSEDGYTTYITNSKTGETRSTKYC